MGAALAREGTGFRTWAPNARAVAVVAGAKLAAAVGAADWKPSDGDRLQPLGDGTWGGFLADVGEGDPYLFFISGERDVGDQGGWKRDPYARELSFQPVHPQSLCLVRSPDSYPWHDRDWKTPDFSDLIIYQLHVGTWWALDRNGADVRVNQPGKFLDVVSRIDHLTALGVTAVQLLPIQEYETPRSLGYNGTDLFSPEIDYCCAPDEVRWRLPAINAALARHGERPLTEAQLTPGINQLKCLVDLLHLAGVGVIFDLVFNHAFGHDDHQKFDDGSLWFYDRQRDGDRNRSLYFTDAVWIGPVFAYGRDAVGQFLIDNAKVYLEDYHADGLRYDEISAIVNMGGQSGALFAQRLAQTVRATRASAIQIAEYWNWDRDRPLDPPPRGFGFDAELADGFRDAVRDLLVQARGGLAATLDLPRVGRALEASAGDAWRLDQCLENQDKTYAAHPDAARVPTLAHLQDRRSWYARSRSRAATVLLLIAPGIPTLFMGEEILEDKTWNDSPAFGGLIWWDGLAAREPSTMRDFFRFTSDLVKLRRALPALRAGRLRVTQAKAFERVVVAHRWIEGEGRDVVVVVSFDELPKQGYRVGLPFPGPWREVFNSDVYDAFPNPRPVGNGGVVEASGPPCDEFAFSADIAVPANGGLVLVRS